MDNKDTLSVIQGFLRQVFTENCSCFEKTCEIVFTIDSVASHLLKMFHVLRNSKTCVTFFEKKRRDHASIINEHISSFLSLGIFHYDERKGKFYTSDGKAVSWENMKFGHSEGSRCFCDPLQKLKNELVTMYNTVYYPTQKGRCPKLYMLQDLDIHEFTRALFWYFRKAIVDNLVQHIYTAVTAGSCGDVVKNQGKNRWMVPTISTNMLSCHALSVGSTNITSDYDVTLYGSCVTSVLRGFHEEFSHIFNEISSVVFDTNIYGSSFIEMPKDILQTNSRFYSRIECSSYPKYDSELYYFVDGKNVDKDTLATAKLQQHIWALLKLKRNVNELLLHHPSSTYGREVSKELQILPFLSHLNKYLSEILEVKNILSPGADYNEGKMETNKSRISNCVDHPFLEVISDFSADLYDQYSKTATEKMEKMERLETSDRKSLQPFPPSFMGDMDKRPMRRLALGFHSNSSSRTSLNGLRTTGSSKSLSRGIGSTPSLGSLNTVGTSKYNKLAFSMISNAENYNDLLNTISMFNFYGTETYYTRGAFLHVVFIQQTCKGKATNALLDTDALMDSFIENYADYLSHDKEKYRKRMVSALKSVLEAWRGKDVELLDNCESVLQELGKADMLAEAKKSLSTSDDREMKEINFLIEENKSDIANTGIDFIMFYVCANVLTSDLPRYLQNLYEHTTAVNNFVE